MNTVRHTLSFVAACAAVAGASLAQAEPATTVAAATTPSAPCASGRITPLQQRLLDKADQGVAPFVQFIYRTRAIYQLDAYEVAGQLEGWRQRRGCASAEADTPASGG